MKTYLLTIFLFSANLFAGTVVSDNRNYLNGIGEKLKSGAAVVCMVAARCV